jgi:hypothetical protein
MASRLAFVRIDKLHISDILSKEISSLKQMVVRLLWKPFCASRAQNGFRKGPFTTKRRNPNEEDHHRCYPFRRDPGFC